MKFVLAVSILVAGITARAVPLAEAMKMTNVECTLTSDGRSKLALTVTNRTASSLSLEIPVGMIAAGKSGARVVVIRTARLQIEPSQTADATVPAVALSLENRLWNEQYSPTVESAPGLLPLFEYSEKHNDLPRATAQMIALLLTVNPTYPQWVDFLKLDAATEPHPTPAEVVAAVDGMSIAQQIAPKAVFRLFGDAELRKRALRNPWSRAKAMKLFAMELPDGVVAPDFGQLLHTKAGDNCPICRMRTRGEEQAGNGL